MPYQDLPDLGMRGLNRDTPPQKLDHTEFSDGMNLRPFDGSLQQVFAFTKDVDDVMTNNEQRRVFATTQWTKSGEGRTNVAYLYTTSNTDANNLSLQVIEDLLGSQIPVEGVMAHTPTDDNSRFGVDLFAFNDVLIVNDGSNHPVWLSRETVNGDEVYTARLIPGWPSGAVTSVVANDPYFVLDNSLLNETEWQSFLPADYVRVHGGTSDVSGENNLPIIGQRFISTSASNVVTGAVGTPVTAQRMVAFNGRLIALNISEEYLSSENYGNTTMLWSTPITSIGTLSAVGTNPAITFQPLSSNSAGDDILTETNGEIYDAVALGQYLIVYKSDGAYRYIDTGEPLYLVGEPFLTDDGLFSPKCAVDIGNGQHFVVGSHGVFLHDGGPNKRNISRGRVERYLYSRINPGVKDSTFVFHHQTEKEVWICYPHIPQWDQTASYTSGVDTVYREVSENGTYVGKYYIAWQPLIDYYGQQSYTTYSPTDNYVQDDVVLYYLDGEPHVYRLNFSDADTSQDVWDPEEDYNEGDYVSFDDAWYEAENNITGDVSNQDPTVDTTNWTPAIATGVTPGSNDIWNDRSIDFENVGKDPRTTGAKPERLLTFDDYHNLDARLLNPSQSFYWLEVEGGGCNQALIYNYEQDTWYERRVPMYLTSPGVYPFGTESQYQVPTNEDYRGDGLKGIVGTDVNGTLVILGYSGNGFYNLRNERHNQILDDADLSDYGNLYDESSNSVQDGNTGTNNRTGFIEFHYLPFGDSSKIKHLKSIYPHTTGMVTIDVDTTNNLGITGEPNFLTDDREFDASNSDDYKLDYRVHGRYYHLKIESATVPHTLGAIPDKDIINPQMTGVGLEIKLGGQR